MLHQNLWYKESPLEWDKMLNSSSVVPKNWTRKCRCMPLLKLGWHKIFELPNLYFTSLQKLAGPKADLKNTKFSREANKTQPGVRTNAQRACKICLLFFKRVQGLVLNQAAHLSSVWHLSHHVKLASASNTSLSPKDKINFWGRKSSSENN